MKKVKPISPDLVYRYLRVMDYRFVRAGESCLELVAESLCSRHGLTRGNRSVRVFVDDNAARIRRDLRDEESRLADQCYEVAPEVAAFIRSIAQEH